MKGYSAFPRSPELEPPNKMPYPRQFFFVGEMGLTLLLGLQSVYSKSHWQGYQDKKKTLTEKQSCSFTLDQKMNFVWLYENLMK